jgi:hypothetical protein
LLPSMVEAQNFSDHPRTSPTETNASELQRACQTEIRGLQQYNTFATVATNEAPGRD